ncbi:hypothetical protein ABH900_003535 [Stenotrophomonas sp. AN71]|uniref:hypothetical protein n=1 Tax=Stenotrophomonas sp. AN71 TaxID=3156253 RepID=UPI003D22F558
MLKSAGAGILLLTGAALAAGDAGARVVRCETCLTDSDYRDVAVRLGPGTHLVYNVTANQIQQYYVGRDADDDGDEANSAGAEGPVMERPVSRPASQKD